MKVSVDVAVRIAEKVFDSGLAGVKKPDNIRNFIKNKRYMPVYKSL